MRKLSRRAEMKVYSPPSAMAETVYRMLSDRSLLAFTYWAESLNGREQKELASYMEVWR